MTVQETDVYGAPVVVRTVVRGRAGVVVALAVLGVLAEVALVLVIVPLLAVQVADRIVRLIVAPAVKAPVLVDVKLTVLGSV